MKNIQEVEGNCIEITNMNSSFRLRNDTLCFRDTDCFRRP